MKKLLYKIFHYRKYKRKLWQDYIASCNIVVYPASQDVIDDFNKKYPQFNALNNYRFRYSENEFINAIHNYGKGILLKDWRP